MPTINFKVNFSYGGDSALNSDHTSPQATLIMFILWGIILPLVAAAGLVGNILTMIVFWRKEMRSTTILYLRGLVITDTGILIGSVLTLTPLSCVNYIHKDVEDYFRDFIYPVIHTPGYYIMMTLQQCNVWITVSVSMERYIAICHPFRAARLITRRKTIIVLISVVIISLFYNIPHLFASTTVHCPQEPLPVVVANGQNSSDYNSSLTFTQPQFLPTTVPPLPTTNQPQLLSTIVPQLSTKSRCLIVQTTHFADTRFYILYRSMIYCAIIYVIPFLALLILNIFLIKELMVMQRRRTGTSIHDENEANLSLVMVLIVVVFIFCQTPGLISQFDLFRVDIFINWLTFSNFLFTLNSAVNFLIYTAFGRKFRKVLLRVFRHLRQRNHRQSQSSFRMTQYTEAEFDTCEPTETHCAALRGVSCYKKKTNQQRNQLRVCH